jgi:N-acetylglucosamine-6-phosphate deacetylase
MIDIRREPAGEIVVSAPGTPCRYALDADGRIQAAEPAAASGGDIVTLGLVDIQVNGFAGVDFNADGLTVDALDRALAAMLATGVTRCLPTLITAEPARLRARLLAIDAAVAGSRLGPWMVEGLHIEGPFLSPEDGYAGCHPKDAMRPPSIATYDDLTAGLRTPVRLVTVAPERDGAIPLIVALRGRGIGVAIGHTKATRAEIEQAAAAGARLSTHLGNGIGHQLAKNENPLFAQLGEDRLAASFIADGIHIAPYMLQSYIRAKQPGRTVLVSDATAGAAAPPGRYTLGDLAIERGADGVVREPGSPYLAGSSATLDGCLRNVMQWFGYEFATAFAMARAHPLAVLGQPPGPARGDVAEFVRWRRDDDGWHVVGAQVGPWAVDA